MSTLGSHVSLFLCSRCLGSVQMDTSGSRKMGCYDEKSLSDRKGRGVLGRKVGSGSEYILS